VPISSGTASSAGGFLRNDKSPEVEICNQRKHSQTASTRRSSKEQTPQPNTPQKAMKKIPTATATIALLFTLMTSTASAALLYGITVTKSATDDFTVDPAHLSVTTAANVSGSSEAQLASFTATPGSQPAGGVALTRFNNNNGNFTIASSNGTSIDNASEFNGGYLAFTVTAAPGYHFSLTDLSFDAARSGAAGTRGYTFYTALNGAAFAYTDSNGIFDIHNETGTRASLQARSIDLSAPEYQNLTSIAFRIYAATDNSGHGVEFNNISLNGTVTVIPEPSTFALMAGFLVFALVTFRRRMV
jgi:hypothetical protein